MFSLLISSRNSLGVLSAYDQLQRYYNPDLQSSVCQLQFVYETNYINFHVQAVPVNSIDSEGSSFQFAMSLYVLSQYSYGVDYISVELYFSCCSTRFQNLGYIFLVSFEMISQSSFGVFEF
ncbi:Hypothetical_protein [Hexamita inflata]|uniref:Hypothetical_protein n=1 Tax=Hexamita inflata TaxID=28002 RepID=A0AA86UZV0_9EUKA|nr:Hypothetical protein HINF_LOCUS58352 [Hexamita inflata]